MNVDNSIVFVLVFVTVNDLTLLRGRPTYAEYVATSIMETYKCVGGTGIWQLSLIICVMLSDVKLQYLT